MSTPDLYEVFALHAAGRTRVSYETRPLADVNQGISDVLHGRASDQGAGAVVGASVLGLECRQIFGILGMWGANGSKG